MSRRIRPRALIARIHRWAGLVLLIPVVLISLTGAILAFQREIDLALNQDLWAATHALHRVSYDTMVRAADRADPGHGIVKIEPAQGRGSAAVLTNADDLSIFVDPATGRVIATRRFDETALGWVTELHLALLVPGESGQLLVGAVAIALLLFVVTGVYLWWPKGRGWAIAFKMRPRAPKLVVTYDLHRLIGVYTAVILLLLALTGAMITFSSWQAILHTGAIERSAPLGELQMVARPGSLEATVQGALRQLPAGQLVQIRPSGEPGEPVALRLRVPGEPWRLGRVFAKVDAASGRVLEVSDGSTGPLAGPRAVSWLYHLHLGHWGELWSYEAGVATRALWVIAALGSATLGVSGALVWWWRRKPKSKAGQTARA